MLRLVWQWTTHLVHILPWSGRQISARHFSHLWRWECCCLKDECWARSEPYGQPPFPPLYCCGSECTTRGFATFLPTLQDYEHPSYPLSFNTIRVISSIEDHIFTSNLMEKAWTERLHCFLWSLSISSSHLIELHNVFQTLSHHLILHSILQLKYPMHISSIIDQLFKLNIHKIIHNNNGSSFIFAILFSAQIKYNPINCILKLFYINIYYLPSM